MIKYSTHPHAAILNQLEKMVNEVDLWLQGYNDFYGNYNRESDVYDGQEYKPNRDRAEKMRNARKAIEEAYNQFLNYGAASTHLNTVMNIAGDLFTYESSVNESTRLAYSKALNTLKVKRNKMRGNTKKGNYATVVNLLDSVYTTYYHKAQLS